MQDQICFWILFENHVKMRYELNFIQVTRPLPITTYYELMVMKQHFCWCVDDSLRTQMKTIVVIGASRVLHMYESIVILLPRVDLISKRRTYKFITKPPRKSAKISYNVQRLQKCIMPALLKIGNCVTIIMQQYIVGSPCSI